MHGARSHPRVVNPFSCAFKARPPYTTICPLYMTAQWEKRPSGSDCESCTRVRSAHSMVNVACHARCVPLQT